MTSKKNDEVKCFRCHTSQVCPFEVPHSISYPKYIPKTFIVVVKQYLILYIININRHFYATVRYKCLKGTRDC